MARYTPPLRDMQFVMHEVLDATQILQQMSRHAEIGRDLLALWWGGQPAVEPREAGRLAGRHVALVDDVMTTGATVAEIARELRRAGAAGVQVWAVARTPRD